MLVLVASYIAFFYRVLLEELDQSRRRDGKRINAASSDSEGEVSDSGLVSMER